MPPGVQLSFPGSPSQAMSSETVFTGSAGFTTSRPSASSTCATGTKSFSGSYGMFFTRNGFTACVPMLPITSV